MRLAFTWSCLAALCLTFASCATIPPPPVQETRAKPARALRVATYNIYVGARAWDQTAAVIRRTKADVVALQEVTPAAAESLERRLSCAYPHRHFAPGLALLSRYPLRAVRHQRSRHGINGFLFAEVAHPRGRLQIANLHLDPLRLWTTRGWLTLPYQLWRGQAAIHRAELSQVFAQLRPRQPTILLGDFNSASRSVPEALRERGFTSRPDRTPTLRFSFLGVRIQQQIDFIFHDDSFKNLGTQVIPGRPSDHDAVVGDLAMKQPNP